MQPLRGKAVLVEFWTFACFNSRNTLPYVKAWHEKYHRQGLVIIGVHTPESERERKLENVHPVDSPVAAGQSLVADVRSFRNGTPTRDDETLLVLQRVDN